MTAQLLPIRRTERPATEGGDLVPDEPDAALDPTPLDPAEEARVRRLLAEARHVGPPPDEVADRLDAALVRLVEGRAAHDADRSVVVDLSARRRRLRVGAALVAAAATVVLGVSLPSLTGGLSLGGGDSEDAATSGQESAAESGRRQKDGGGAPDAASAPEEESVAPLMALPEVSADRFRRDAEAARDHAPAHDHQARAVSCATLPADAEQLVPVTYGGRDALLVFGEPTGDRQRVELYLCPEGEPVRSATIPAP
jgi:hypothetical protein